MVVIRRALLGLAMLGLGCSHARARGDGDHESTNERSVAIGADVAVHATRWDVSLVAATAADVHNPEARAALNARLSQRYLGRGTAFTVLIELAHRPEADDPLADPKAWWFALARGGELVRASRVEPLAVDRFPAAGGGKHLRIAVLVVFEGPAPTGDVELRIGTDARAGRRLLLGRTVADRGTSLRWRSDGAATN